MKLSNIIATVGECQVVKMKDLNIDNIFMDSREKVENGLFFCISGARFDAHSFAPSAIANGAIALVTERALDIDIPQIVVQNSRIAMALISSVFYNSSWKNMKLVGITGTKGKTTTTYLVKSILETAGYKVGVIGTTGHMIGDRFINAGLTTPDPIDLHKAFKTMADEKVDYVCMEVSAHALAMHRLEGIYFETGCYTNLSQDHLDYFNDMQHYFEAKKIFFSNKWLETCSLNIDEPSTKDILADLNLPFTTYGICQNADVAARDIEVQDAGIRFKIRLFGKEEHPVHLQLPGMFNVYNGLAAASIALNLGIKPSDITKGLEAIRAVPGRAELLETGTPYKVVLDYSHSPNALENILSAMREFTKKRLIVLFGCGGDRDKLKRPLMGKIAGEMADYSILTSDNPRTEKPDVILEEIEKGIKETQGEYIVIENRRKAILHALTMSDAGDIVVLAGKGHEKYQEINGVKHPFDEKVVVQELLQEMK